MLEGHAQGSDETEERTVLLDPAFLYGEVMIDRLVIAPAPKA